jgi:ell wall binding domain 2 (CWB2)
VRLPGPLESAIDWLRYDLPARVNRRVLIPATIALAAIAIVALAVMLSSGDQGERERRVVTFSVGTDDPQEAGIGELGFPLVATRNTTRVGGPDAIVDAAAVALATHPPTPGADPIEAAVLVPDGNWQAGVASSVLAGPPLRAPILIGTAGGVPDPTADALALLKPRGGSGSSDVAVYRVGDVAAPAGLESDTVEGSSPAEIATSIDQLRGRLLQPEPAHILIVSSEQPAYAMPAAAWAARSGDPILFSGRDQVPRATLDALESHKESAIYVLGPESVISEEAVQEISKVTPSVQRIGEEGPVANAIAFARYPGTDFGWNINDPGHGLVLASSSRPLDATAAASLSASGKWGPLLVTDTARRLPPELRTFLLDIKPGYQDDPTRAVYNHVWLIGDASAIGARAQAEIDELAELVQIGGGAPPPDKTTDAEPGIAIPGGPEDEPKDQPGKKGSP